MSLEILENEFEFKNTLLSGIAEKSSSFGIIIRDSTNEKRRFNLKLNASSYESLENSLGDCGLKLRRGTGVVKVLEITFLGGK